ncbi:MAG: S1 RNA-binding domain-containing protein [Chloroflexota bacterium]
MVGPKKKTENQMPIVDEGWWNSVLADESRYAPPPPVRQAGKTEVRSDAAPAQPAQAKPSADWTQVKDLYLRDQIVDLKVTGFNRGGLLVEGDGLYGFVPFSHLVELAGKTEASQREHDLEGFVGRDLRLKVIECVPEDGRIVFSERAAQAEPGKRAQLFGALHPGERVSGTVTNITDFGVFVDLGGVEGLIHISELSWGRVIHPNQIVKMGQALEVQVLDLAPERCRVALSLKRLQANPWLSASTAFPEGRVVPATITSVVSYGAFARLDAGVEGLIHASEMPLADGQTVKDFLSEGQGVQVRVLHVDASHQRMGLSMRLNHEG